MKVFVTAICLLGLATMAFSQEATKPRGFKVHKCEKDAVAKAKELLRFHSGEDSNAEIPGAGIEDQVTVKAPFQRPGGGGQYDVLEVGGAIYKAEYRMRLIYMQSKDAECVLMGQEILDLSNPY